MTVTHLPLPPRDTDPEPGTPYAVEPVEDFDAPGQPQQDTHAEQAVLGAMLLSRDVITEIAELIRPEHFYRPAHEAIAAAVLHLHDRNEPTDVVTVAATLHKAGDLQRIGGHIYLHTLLSVVPSPASGPHYARVVREKWSLRRVQELGRRLTQLGGTSDTDASATVDIARGELEKVADRIHGHADLGDLDESFDATFDRLQTGERGASTGFPDLDRYIGGMRDGDLIVAAALSSGGKSLFAEQVAWHAALPPHGRPVYVASLEMTRHEWNMRALSNYGQINLNSLVNSNLSEHEWERASKARHKLADARMFVDDRESSTVPDIRAAARSFARRHGGLGLIVIDYLQMVSAVRQHKVREQEVAEIAVSLKQLAKAMNCPVLALSQLNNDSVAAGRKPTMHDLRESKAIGHNANVVILLHREKPTSPEEDDLVHVGIGKNRHGPLGSFEMTWEGHYARFRARPWRGQQ